MPLARSYRRHRNITPSPLNHQIFLKFLCYIAVAVLVFSLIATMGLHDLDFLLPAGDPNESSPYLFLRYVPAGSVIASRGTMGRV
jgi:hypothetical protein